MKTLKRRRVEIISFEQERLIIHTSSLPCPVCGLMTEMITVEQASAVVQLELKEVINWLVNGLAHGVQTVGGQYRVCRQSLFKAPEVPEPVVIDLKERFKK